MIKKEVDFTAIDKFTDDILTGNHKRAKLTIVQKLNNITHDKLKRCLHKLYHSGSVEYVVIGSILNSIFTHKRLVFMLTKTIVSNLVSIDSNNKYKSINMNQYRSVMFNLLHSKMVIRLRQPDYKQAGLYEIVHPELLDIMSNLIDYETIEDLKEETIDAYDKYVLDKKNDEFRKSGRAKLFEDDND